MAYETILVDVVDGVATITFNRPKAMNALNSTLISELSRAVSDAEADPAVRCMILTGNAKAFAAGADITEMAEKSFVDVTTSDMFGAELNPLLHARKPVIAAVAGYALGGGCELAMMCDFILCADTAKFGQPEINLGVIAGIGGTQRLTHFVGKSKSMEMNLTGRMMDADEALQSGLVSRVVPADDLMDEAMTAARTIASKSQIAVMAAKDAVNRAYETTMAEGLRFERRTFLSLFATQDQKEGMKAFVEKRKPKFQDK